MRSLIIVALLAFLAVGFVAARPAEAEAEDVAVEELADGEDTAESTGDEATQDADADADETQDANAGEETKGDSASETEGGAAEETKEDSVDEESSDADDVEDEDTRPKKQIRPFWPRFGGHGPVGIPRRGLLIRRA